MRNISFLFCLWSAALLTSCKKEGDEGLTAAFTFSKNGLAVQFTNSSKHADSVSWHFGDSTVSDQQNPLHVYSKPGSYTAVLEVFQHCKDENPPEKEKHFCSSASASKTFTLDIIEAPGDADMTLNYMEVEEKKDSAVLYLYGKFSDLAYGDALPGSTVIINGHAANRILFTTSMLIKCSIGGQDALNGHGQVYVQLKGKKTNTRKLTLWKDYITYHKEDLNTLHEEAVFQIALRADMDAHESIPLLITPKSSCTSASYADFTLGGQGDCPDGSMRVSLSSANGTLAWSEPYRDHASGNAYPENFQFECTFKDHRFTVTGLRVFKKDASNITTSHPGSAPYTIKYDFRIDALGVNDSFDILLTADGHILGMKVAQTPHSTEYGFQCWSAANVPTFTNSIDIHAAPPL